MKSNCTSCCAGIALVGLLAINAVALSSHGLVGFVKLVTANSAVVAVLVDLTIALTMISVWLWRDARSRGLSPIPYLVVTIVLGSVGPLVYLIRKGMSCCPGVQVVQPTTT